MFVTLIRAFPEVWGRPVASSPRATGLEQPIGVWDRTMTPWRASTMTTLLVTGGLTGCGTVPDSRIVPEGFAPPGAPVDVRLLWDGGGPTVFYDHTESGAVSAVADGGIDRRTARSLHRIEQPRQRVRRQALRRRSPARGHGTRPFRLASRIGQGRRDPGTTACAHRRRLRHGRPRAR